MNTFMNQMKANTNYGYTENGAIKHVSTLNKVFDMFSFGGAYRSRSENDTVLLFKEAFEEDRTLALRCLFYLRDCRGGQGERRFFRVCFKWLANNYPKVAKSLIDRIPEYGRYDDWFVLFNTPVEDAVMNAIRNQLMLDMACEKNGISLLAKWMPSENASSAETIARAKRIRNFIGISSKQYRQMLSLLRKKINVLERLMSANEWDKIEFDKIPSRAGIIYRNAFARRDMIARKYEAFAKDKDTKVNAGVLYPVDIAHRAFRCYHGVDDPERLMLQKYWDNLPNYYGDRQENGIAIVDVSGSMSGTPMEAAVSLGAYIAEKAHGPFANHFITFSANPRLVEFRGVDIVDKFNRATRADWGMNTNLRAVFDMLLNTALHQGVKAEDMPTRLYIFSDMEFDAAFRKDYYSPSQYRTEEKVLTLLESIQKKWAMFGYELPDVIFWNLDARSNNIPAMGKKFSYVSGFAPVMIEQVLSGKTGIDLMLEKLNSERYASITA